MQTWGTSCEVWPGGTPSQTLARGSRRYRHSGERI
jgi:hypothetical protein